MLVVRGEPGVGKSALLDYVSEHAEGCRVARASGVEYEAELTLAGLQQLLPVRWNSFQRIYPSHSATP